MGEAEPKHRFYYSTTLLLYYSTALLLYCSTTLLLYYSTTLLLYYTLLCYQVVADLPYGKMHARLDAGALVRTLAALLRPGGKAVLLGGGGPTGTAAACVKSARRCPTGGWAVELQLPCHGGGAECTAVVLRRLAPQGCPSGARRGVGRGAGRGAPMEVAAASAAGTGDG